MDVAIELTDVKSEADVELKIITPILIGSEFIDLPLSAIKGKTYLSPSIIDKKAGKTTGYYPDFSAWLLGLPVLVVEAKPPNVAVEIGYREARLYANVLNSRYKGGINPCQRILACNGSKILAGPWDSDPTFEADVSDLVPGSTKSAALRALCGVVQLEELAKAASAALHPARATAPYSLIGGQALLNSKKPYNSFATELAPILRKYFTSTSQNNDPEIYKYGYVATDDVTTYDSILEALLKDRMGTRIGPLTEDLSPTRSSEPKLTAAIDEYKVGRPEGQLQLIIGGVGSGKSLFARRYKELLQPEADRASTHWAFIDFNVAPPSSQLAEQWFCEQFIESFRTENPSFDPFSDENIRGVFASELQKRKAIYAQLKGISNADARRQQALDLTEWQDDPPKVAFGICQHFVGQRQETVVVVMDNVDKLDLQGQLRAFQLSLWFMQKSKAFVVLQMRDETYERYKDLPPLDTYRTGVVFHISPPRFLDVVKRRLELSLSYLASRTDKVLEYDLSNGARIRYPNTMLGEFLKSVYLELFEKRHNVSRVLQGLAGRDVRKALEMFVSVLNSGHLTSEAITSNVKGAGAVAIHEYTVLRILMRTEYRFFGENSGFVSNVFHFEEVWNRPSNFLMPDILFWLYERRKLRGQIGLEGYFTVQSIVDELQLRGYTAEDVVDACSWLLRQELVEADHMNRKGVDLDDSVKVTASGFIHLRVLCERTEYLYGVLSVTPMFDTTTAKLIANIIERENQRDHVPLQQMVQCIERFHAYLKKEHVRLSRAYPAFGGERTGADYVLKQIESTLAHYRNPLSRNVAPNILDD